MSHEEVNQAHENSIVKCLSNGGLVMGSTEETHPTKLWDKNGLAYASQFFKWEVILFKRNLSWHELQYFPEFLHKNPQINIMCAMASLGINVYKSTFIWTIRVRGAVLCQSECWVRWTPV